MSDKHGSRSSFTGKIGFVMAAAGSAVGLGNIWRFPYLAAEYGGGIFLLVYIILAITFGFGIMVTEVAMGRKTRLSTIGAYKALNKNFSFLGIIASVVPMIITPYYCVIGGWICKYLFAFVSGDAQAAAGTVNVGGEEVAYFSNFITQTWQPIGWFLVFLGLTALVILLGVQSGIEKVSKIMMPILAVITVALCVYTVTLPGAGAGVRFYFEPNFSDFSMKTVLAAVGQLFYSMSLAMGIMITYGSYMKKDTNIESAVRQIEIFDTAIAFLAGLMIIPAIFAIGSTEDLKAGPSLIFIVLPKIFESIPGGTFIGIAFFTLVLFAALTSSISLLETMTSIFDDKHKKGRSWALLISVIICIGLGLPSSLGYGPWAGVQILGMAFLDFFDFLSNSVLMPIVALLTCFLVGWVAKPKVIIDEVEINGKFKAKGLYVFIVKYFGPICLLAILISSVLNSLGIISI